MNITNATMPFADLKLEDGEFKNPRTTSGLADPEIRELALHIGRHGLLVPLIVSPTGLIASGQRRYRAIEWLQRWFIPRTANMDAAMWREADDGVTAILRELSTDEFNLLCVRARELCNGVPVRVVPQDATSDEIDTIAISDNLLRSDLSTFEVAKHLWGMHVRGTTGSDIAKMIGKSTSYVSRKLSAWKGSGPELRGAWEDGSVTEDVVLELVKLPLDAQVQALLEDSSGEMRGKRGPANRPGIDTVKDVLRELDIAASKTSVTPYQRGIVDALRWITGGKAPSEFVNFVNFATGDDR